MVFDLAACKLKFDAFSSNNKTYNFTGKVHGIFSDRAKQPPLITYEGCKHFCGTGTQYYSWAAISSTITTWVFPVVGLLLQAPFESNKNASTILALARWLGNPIAGMSYTFWNTRVIGRCALMVDMATPYDGVPDSGSHFAQIRDSLYLLSVMNQYTIKARLPSIDAAEKLLRIALFSDYLQLTAADGRTDDLFRTRQELARIVRIGRKKGVVGVFLSEALFVTALAISIYGAFSRTGNNEIAHELGIGLLLSWLPILVLSSITDRNLVDTDEIRQQLNNFLDLVRTALLDAERQESYFKTTGTTEDKFAWTKLLEDDHNAFFTQFAGQGRVRWHVGNLGTLMAAKLFLTICQHGCANSILSSMENAWIADAGRGWMDDPDRARIRMILDVEPNHREFVWFDRQIFWQIAGSTPLLYGTAGGAFILPFFTPTVGIGCWSGGYLIYIVVATSIFAIEMLLWWCRARYSGAPRWIPYYVRNLPLDYFATHLFGRVRRTLDRQNSHRWVISARNQLRAPRKMWLDLNFTDRFDVILRLLEIGNTTFLIYIICAQTIGAYSNRACRCSIWSSLGGYMDFESYAYYREKGVRHYWGYGTGISCVSLAAGLIHIVIEYCTQSHLSTEDYENAARGLRMTRWFKKYTDSRLPGRYLARYMHKITHGFPWLRTLGGSIVKYMHKMTFGIFESHSKSFVWDWMTKDERIRMSRIPVIDGQIPSEASEAQVYTSLPEKTQEASSPTTGTGRGKLKDRQCADAASVQESTKEKEADTEADTRMLS